MNVSSMNLIDAMLCRMSMISKEQMLDFCNKVGIRKGNLDREKMQKEFERRLKLWNV